MSCACWRTWIAFIIALVKRSSCISAWVRGSERTFTLVCLRKDFRAIVFSSIHASRDAFLGQSFDLLVGEAVLAKDGGGVHALFRRDALGSGSDRCARHDELSALMALSLREDPAGDMLRILEKILRPEDRLKAAIVLSGEGFPFGVGARKEKLRDLAVPFLLVRTGHQHGGIEVQAVALTERLPELGLKRAEAHRAVLGAVRPVVGDGAHQHAAASRKVEPTIGAGKAEEGERDRGFGHRDIDETPLTGPLTILKRREDADRREEAATDITDLHAGSLRRAAERTRDPQRSAARDVVDVVSGAMAKGAVLPIARDGAINQSRVDRSERLIAEPEAIHDARAVALDEDVILRNELEEDLATFFAL